MLTGALASLFGVTAIGWLVDRLHFRTNQLKALDKTVGVKPGTLEAQVNSGVEKAAVDELNKLVK